MTVAHEAPPSDKQGEPIPTQNSPGNSIKPFLQLIPDQRDWPLDSELPKRKALDDVELALVRERLNDPEEIHGKAILTAILEQLGTLPSLQDKDRAEERKAIEDLILKADKAYASTMYRETTKGVFVLDFKKFQTLLTMTESVESDPLLVSTTRAANYIGLKHHQKAILDADRIARIMQLFSTHDGDLDTILRSFGVDEN